MVFIPHYLCFIMWDNMIKVECLIDYLDILQKVTPELMKIQELHRVNWVENDKYFLNSIEKIRILEENIVIYYEKNQLDYRQIQMTQGMFGNKYTITKIEGNQLIFKRD